MNWYIGQDIVAVKDHSAGRFKRGDEFKVLGLKRCSCKCRGVEIDIGHTIKRDLSCIFYCDSCFETEKLTSNTQWYLECSFAPLDPIKEAISELMEETQVAPVLVPHTTEI